MLKVSDANIKCRFFVAMALLACGILCWLALTGRNQGNQAAISAPVAPQKSIRYATRPKHSAKARKFPSPFLPDPKSFDCGATSSSVLVRRDRTVGTLQSDGRLQVNSPTGEALGWTDGGPIRVSWGPDGCRVTSLHAVEVSGFVKDSHGEPLVHARILGCGYLPSTDADGFFGPVEIPSDGCPATLVAYRDGLLASQPIELSPSIGTLTLQTDWRPLHPQEGLNLETFVLSIQVSNAYLAFGSQMAGQPYDGPDEDLNYWQMVQNQARIEPASEQESAALEAERRFQQDWAEELLHGLAKVKEELPHTQPRSGGVRVEEMGSTVTPPAPPSSKTPPAAPGPSAP